MSEAINLLEFKKKAKVSEKKADKESDFGENIKANKAKQERLKKERQQNNKTVAHAYRLRKKNEIQ